MKSESDSVKAGFNSERLTCDEENKKVRYRNGDKYKLHSFNGNSEFFKRQPVPLERFVSIVTDFFTRKISCDLDRVCLDVYPDELVVCIYDGEAPLGRLTENERGFCANLRRTNNISRVRFSTFLDLWKELSPEYAKQSYLNACPATLRVVYFPD